jgi:hypothetical protein
MEESRKALLDAIQEIDQFEEAPIQNSGKAIRPEKDPLNKWEGWNSAPNFLMKMVLNSKEPIMMKGFMEQVIRELNMTPREQRKYLRPDPVPASYRENYQELLRDVPRLNVNPTGLTIEQILAQDRHFHRTYVNNNIFGQIMARYGLTRYMEGKKWEIKHHKLTNYGWPKFSHDFKDLGFIHVGPEGVKDVGYGWGAAYEIPFTTIDMAAGGTYDPDYWSLFFLAQAMGIFGDERGFLGGSGRNTTNKGAPNLFGLYNWTVPKGVRGTAAYRDGIISPTDYGFSQGKTDFEQCFRDALTAFKGNSVFSGGGKPVAFVTTAGIADETYVHDSTVGDLKTEYQVLQHKWFMTGPLDSWYISDNLTSTATASIAKDTQRWLMFVASPNYIRRTVVYPLQRKILSERFKTYPDDIAFAYITGDILQVYDNNAIVGPGSDSNAGSGTHGKCTYAGWDMNRLFMDSNTVALRALRPGIE